MKKLAIILFLILFLSNASNGQDLIEWDKSRPLVWDDFKGKPDKKNPYEALTHGGLKYSFESKADGQFVLKLYVTFDPTKSWVKDQKNSDLLLAHEQIHFDIYELYARIFVKKIADSKALCNKNFSDKVMTLFHNTFEEMVKFQEKYDKETDHSKINIKQQEWAKEVQKLLKEYDEHARREIFFEMH